MSVTVSAVKFVCPNTNLLTYLLSVKCVSCGWAEDFFATFIDTTQQQQAFHMKCQRKFLRIRWQDHVRNDEVASHTGLRPVMESIRRWREAIFGHVARMSPNIPAHQPLRLQVETSLGRRPDRDWVRSSGHPCNRCIDQLHQDHQRPPADLWRAAIQRGHTGATLRSSTTTRWRRRRPNRPGILHCAKIFSTL